MTYRMENKDRRSGGEGKRECLAGRKIGEKRRESDQRSIMREKEKSVCVCVCCVVYEIYEYEFVQTKVNK